jgi:hypothetical protein
MKAMAVEYTEGEKSNLFPNLELYLPPNFGAANFTSLKFSHGWFQFTLLAPFKVSFSCPFEKHLSEDMRSCITLNVT